MISRSFVPPITGALAQRSISLLSAKVTFSLLSSSLYAALPPMPAILRMKSVRVGSDAWWSGVLSGTTMSMSKLCLWFQREARMVPPVRLYAATPLWIRASVSLTMSRLASHSSRAGEGIVSPCSRRAGAVSSGGRPIG